MENNIIEYINRHFELYKNEVIWWAEDIAQGQSVCLACTGFEFYSQNWINEWVTEWMKEWINNEWNSQWAAPHIKKQNKRSHLISYMTFKL
jgi:hypothetical protein